MDEHQRQAPSRSHHRGTRQFTTSYDDVELLAVVRDVTRALNADEPETVSQKSFYAHRAAAGHPDAPSAKQIAHRLGLSWGEVKALALATNKKWELSLGVRGREPEAPDLGQPDAIAALRLVAHRLGRETLVATEYKYERARLIADDQRRWRHGRQLVLPSLDQVLRIFGDWDEALTAAGLQARPKQARTRPGVPILEALAWAVELHGELPGTSQLEAFARAQGFALAKRRHPWAHYVAEFAARCEAAGVSMPPKMKPGQGAKFAVPIEAATPPWDESLYSHKKRKRWTRDDIVDALVRYLEYVGSGRPTERGYSAFHAGHADTPTFSTLDRYGGMKKLLLEARKRRRAKA